MRRFEIEDGGSRKFWQVAVEGTELTVSFGRLGTGGQTKIKSFESRAAADREATKLVREKTGKGYAEIQAPGETHAKIERPAKDEKVVESVAPEGFASLSPRKLQGLAAKIADPKTENVGKLLERAEIPHAKRSSVLWHIALAGLAPVGGAFLHALAEAAHDATFEAVELALTRVTARPAEGWRRGNWLVHTIRFASRAREIDASRASVLAARLPDEVRAGFVLTSSDAPSDEERLIAIAELRSAAGAFDFHAPELIAPFLRHVTMDELYWTLAERSTHDGELLAFFEMLPSLLAARSDSPAALLDLAARFAARRAKAENQGLERHFQAVAMSVAMRRFADRGEAIPEGLEHTVPWAAPLFRMIRSRPALASGLEALPKARALEIARRTNDLHVALLVLGAHPDAALLVERLLTGAPPKLVDRQDPVQLLVTNSAAVLDVFRKELETCGDPARRRALRMMATSLLVEAGKGNERSDALITAHSRVDAASWGESGLDGLLRGMPEARRDALALRIAGEDEPVDRWLVVGHWFSGRAAAALLRTALERPACVSNWNLVQRVSGAPWMQRILADTVTMAESDGAVLTAEARTALRLDAAPPPETPLARLVRMSRSLAHGPTIRVYAANRSGEGQLAPRGLSRVEGPGPAIDRAALGVPDDAVHALTLDLTEVPELAVRYPEARFLSVYAPDPAAGIWDDGWVVTSPLVPFRGDGGAPVSLVPVHLPVNVFESGHDELLELLHAQHGWVLGKPRFLEDTVEGTGFVMQFGGELGEDFGTADAGEVYVFEDGVFLQSK